MVRIDMSSFAAPISEAIWDMKYRFKSPDGVPSDLTVSDSWRRVANALASVEAEPLAWAGRFNQALDGFRFLPAGRILAGAGTDRSVTLFNCFVMGTIPDSMTGIFESLKEAALTMQQGGGIGYDFSTIRPKGAPVEGVGADASGPLSFMDVWDSMCRTIMSAGSRRGAMMATMRCDHPDIQDFIAAKQDAARLRMFNLSVLATDDFMAAVEADADWPLVFQGRTYRTVRATDLWGQIMRSTYDQAEPGVIFIDRINQMNNLHYAEEISATNPCGEQPLPPYGACLLGSINLAALIRDPFENGHIDDAELSDLVATAVRMMDNVVDASRFPLEAQAAEARAKRRIGLGVTGLADALIMAGLVYGSDAAVTQTARWMAAIRDAAYRASVELAREKGAFPLFDAEAYLSGAFIADLPQDIRDGIAEHGIRNALLTSIAPTGTISLFAGNVSSGIEPVFAFSYTRKVLQKDGTRTEEEVVDYAVAKWRELYGDAELPDVFVSAQTLTPGDHVRMQAVAQKYVDSSISKTINVPEDISFDAFKDVYMQAWSTGCKGCTTYRPNAVTGSVLEVAERPVDAGQKTVGDRVRAARKKVGLSQERIANLIGTTVASVSRKETGKQLEFTRSEAEIIASELGVSLSWLLLGEAAEAPDRVLSDMTARSDGDVVYISEPLERPETLEGATYKLKWPESAHAIYITMNDVVADGRRRPFEIFINSKNMEHYAWTVALTRMISAVFRRGGDVSFVVEELKAVFDPRGGAWMNRKYVPSILAAIGDVIERHMIEIGFIAGPGLGLTEDPAAERKVVGGGVAPTACPSCGGFQLEIKEGCETCLDCGHSKCG